MLYNSNSVIKIMRCDVLKTCMMYMRYLFWYTFYPTPTYWAHHTFNSCLVPTQLTEKIRPYPSENDDTANLSAAGPSLMYASGLSSIVRW